MAVMRYGCRPAARDAEGDSLTWSIANLPDWAEFDPATSDLVGVPGTRHVGTWGNIVISVSDGKTTRSLSPFSITVNQIAVNGTALTNLADDKIYASPNAGAMSLVRTISNLGATNAVIDGLAAGRVCLAVSALTSSGLESDRSMVARKTIA